MKISRTVRAAAVALRRNRTRSALTILGIIIGVTSIILVVSIGDGAESFILGQLEVFGSNTIFVEPGREPSGPSDFAEAFSDSLKERELKAITTKANVPDVERAGPIINAPAVVSYESETKNTIVLGLSDFGWDILGLELGEGRFLDDQDVKSYARTAVLGSDIKEDLFGLSDAVGKSIKVKNQTYRVVGVLQSKGRQSAFLNFDEQVAIPYTTAQRYVTGTDHFNAIAVEVTSKDSLPRAAQDIERTLRELHNIEDPEKDDFHVTTQEQAAGTVGSITVVLQALLGSVAGISLVVGGIGIMNIMLVSVTERTREIGLRKALGARSKDISRQFLIEAVMLTAVGGLVGIGLGLLLALLASVAISGLLNVSWPFVFSIPAALLGIGVSALIGLVFGFYPARQAAKKSPMEALRYE